jgi:hypothetical protein
MRNEFLVGDSSLDSTLAICRSEVEKPLSRRWWAEAIFGAVVLEVRRAKMRRAPQRRPMGADRSRPEWLKTSLEGQLRDNTESDDVGIDEDALGVAVLIQFYL